jgi:hypothetical protein
VKAIGVYAGLALLAVIAGSLVLIALGGYEEPEDLFKQPPGFAR